MESKFVGFQRGFGDQSRMHLERQWPDHTDLLAEPDDDFRAVAERVIVENRELYRRLS